MLGERSFDGNCQEDHSLILQVYRMVLRNFEIFPVRIEE